METSVVAIKDEWKKGARLDESTYADWYARSIEDPNGFWAEHGRRIDWMVVGHGIAVQGVGVNAARPSGVAGSDHEPVQAVVTLHDVR